MKKDDIKIIGSLSSQIMFLSLICRVASSILFIWSSSFCIRFGDFNIMDVGLFVYTKIGLVENFHQP